MAVTINGNVFSGRNIVISGDSVIIDGKQVLEGVSGIVNVVVTGDLSSLKSNSSVEVNGNVLGDVDAGGSISCGDVSGDVDAGGSVNCGNIAGDVDAGGSVNCRKG